MKTHRNSAIFKPTGCLTPEQLKNYGKDDLPPAERHLVERHLIDCELCSEALEGYSMILHPELLDDTLGSVRALTPAVKAKPSTHSWTVWMAAASVVLVVLTILFTYHYLVEPPASQVAMESTPKVPVVPPEKHSVVSGHKPFEPLQDGSKEPGNKSSQTAPDRPGKQPPESGYRQVAAETSQRPAMQETASEASAAEEVVSAPVAASTGMQLQEELKQSRKSSGQQEAERPATSAMATGMADEGQEVLYLYGLKTKIYHARTSLTDSTIMDDKQGVEARFENEQAKKETESLEKKAMDLPSYESLLQAAMKHVKQNEYQQAAVLFENLLVSRPADENAMFYGGLCYYHQGKYKLARQRLLVLLTNKNTLFREEATWNLALVELASGNKKEALRLLDRIESEHGFYSRQATEKKAVIK